MLHRRALIAGFTALVTAPAIVRASSLMPIHSFDDGIDLSKFFHDGFYYLDRWGQKYGTNPVGRISVSIHNGKIIDQSYEVGADLYRLPDFEKASRTGDYTEANKGSVWIGPLSAKSYQQDRRRLDSAIKRYAALA